MEHSETLSYSDKVSKARHSEHHHPVPSFLLKTFNILENPDTQDIASWSSDGKSLMIKDPAQFAEKVLPDHFKHNNLSSFVRQLNMYNFKKLKSKTFDFVFSHENFQRGQRSKLNEIRRKNPDVKLVLSKHKINVDDISEQHPEKLLEENVVLKKVQKEMLDKMKNLSDRVQELKTENLKLSFDKRTLLQNQEQLQDLTPGYSEYYPSQKLAEKVWMPPQLAKRMSPFNTSADVIISAPQKFQFPQQNVYPVVSLSSDQTKAQGVYYDLPVTQTPNVNFIVIAPLDGVERGGQILIPTQQPMSNLYQKRILQPVQGVLDPFNEKTMNDFGLKLERSPFCNSNGVN